MMSSGVIIISVVVGFAVAVTVSRRVQVLSAAPLRSPDGAAQAYRQGATRHRGHRVPSSGAGGAQAWRHGDSIDGVDDAGL